MKQEFKAAKKRRFADSDHCPRCETGCVVAFHTNPSPRRPRGGCAAQGCICSVTRDELQPPVE